jgi:glycosyltransferase involved in cell wall biosynthesis
MGNAAILYLQDGFETSREDLKGRHAAGEGMLRGMARWLDAESCYAYVPDQASFEEFVGKMRSFGLPEGKPCARIAFGDNAALRRPGCLFLPQPKIDVHAWQRRFGSQRDYSLCGVTHTTASHSAMDAIGALLVAPVQPWDAVICTSRSVKATFDRILSEYGEYLRARLGATDIAPKPMLPVIPLGVHCDQFDPPDRDRQRIGWRERLGIGADDLVVLFVGRLSFHAKAHPFPMYRALELASRSAPGRVHLVQAGWFHSPGVERVFREGAEKVAPGVTHHFLDGREHAVRFGIWHAADVFCSLSDNIQETFGLTPLEAMAAGLPVVASDWDGYRETIEHGVQGLLVPTYAPAPGALGELAYLHATGILNYDFYLLNTCSAVAVDVDAAARAFERLFAEPDLRKGMGEAGRRRARELYDWKVIIRRYAELWDEMAERRRRTATESCPKLPGRPSDPLRDDPFALFESYPTHKVGPDSRVVPLGDDLRGGVAQARSLEMNRSTRFPGEETIAALFAGMEGRTPRTLSELLAGVPRNRRGLVTQTVLWLKKMGLVEIEPVGGGRKPE